MTSSTDSSKYKLCRDLPGQRGGGGWSAGRGCAWGRGSALGGRGFGAVVAASAAGAGRTQRLGAGAESPAADEQAVGG